MLANPSFSVQKIDLRKKKKEDLGEDYLHQLVRKNKDHMQVVTPTFHTGNSAISSEGVGQLLQPWLPSMGHCCEEHLLCMRSNH